jgi:hypothetical protein
MYCSKCGNELPQNDNYCSSCNELVQASIRKPKTERSETKKQAILLSTALIIFIGLVCIGVLSLANSSTNTKKTVAEEESLVVDLNASVDFDGTQFIIANADKYDWTNVRIKVNAGLLNNGYYLDTYTLKAGSVYTVGSMQFAKSDGTRFNPFQMKPRKVEISCDTPKGSGYYLARFE